MAGVELDFGELGYEGLGGYEVWGSRSLVTSSPLALIALTAILLPLAGIGGWVIAKWWIGYWRFFVVGF